MINMDLAKLVQLQKIDSKLLDLDNHKGDLPETVQRLKNSFAANTKNLADAKNKLSEAEKAKKENKNEIDELYDKLIKYQEQSYEVKTNKEYDAITIEIETTEKKIEEDESNNKELLLQVASYKEKVAELEIQLRELDAELAKKLIELDEKLSLTEDEENMLKKERDEVTNQINKTLLANYNRIRNGKNGIALSEVSNYTCSECFGTIPAQTAVEVRKMDKIILCELCGRILISTQNGVNQPAVIAE